MKKQTKSYNVKGLSVKQILNISPEEIGKLTERQLKQVTSRLVSASNKRIRSLGKTDVGRSAPAYKSVMESGGQFSVKGKNLNQVRYEFSRAKQFLNMKTSTAKGWKDVRMDIVDRIGDMTDSQSEKFWEVYRKVAESGGIVPKGIKSRRASDRFQREIYNRMKRSNFKLDVDTYVGRMNASIEKIYQKEERKMREYEREMQNSTEIDETDDLDN